MRERERTAKGNEPPVVRVGRRPREKKKIDSSHFAQNGLPLCFTSDDHCITNEETKGHEEKRKREGTNEPEAHGAGKQRREIRRPFYFESLRRQQDSSILPRHYLI